MKKRSTKCTGYFQYFELARSAVLEFMGYSYDEMAASGILWPVTDSTARYLRLLASPEILIGRVRTRLREIGPTEP